MLNADAFLLSFHRRGLNPPQRVKSISMTSFTPQEIENLQGQGNEVSLQCSETGLPPFLSLYKSDNTF